MYKLTISKALDRKGLANALKDLFPLLSVKERLSIVDNLPFVDDYMFAEAPTVKNILSPYCEFTYEELPRSHIDYGAATPPWESSEYLSARSWYNTLPKEDQEKIDVLISANIAWA